MRKATWSLLLALSLATAPAWADLAPFPWGGHRRPERPIGCGVAPVRSVEHAEILRGPPPRLRVRGTAPTAGWREPELRFRAVTGAGTRRATAVYEFLGCATPIAAQVLTLITAETALRLPAQSGGIRFIRVKAATNSILLKLDGPRRR